MTKDHTVDFCKLLVYTVVIFAIFFVIYIMPSCYESANAFYSVLLVLSIPS